MIFLQNLFLSIESGNDHTCKEVKSKEISQNDEGYEKQGPIHIMVLLRLYVYVNLVDTPVHHINPTLSC